MHRELEDGGCNTCWNARRTSVHDSAETQQPKHARCRPPGNKEKKNIWICVYVLMYAYIGLPTLALLSWIECGHNKENPIFHLENRGKGKLNSLSFTDSAWLQEKRLLVNSYWIRIFRKLWNFLRFRGPVVRISAGRPLIPTEVFAILLTRSR
jgi:hypothetical protein